METSRFHFDGCSGVRDLHSRRVHVCEHDAPQPTSLETEDSLGGTLEEKARAASGFMAYCGRYEVHGDHVVHHIEQSLFPNWVGTSQKRFIELEGDRLTLPRTPSEFDESLLVPDPVGNKLC